MLQHKSKCWCSVRAKNSSNFRKMFAQEHKQTKKHTNKNDDTAAFQKFKSCKLLLFLNIQLVFLSNLPNPLVFLKFISNF